MTEIIFKNRMTQESPYVIKQLKSLWIEMNIATFNSQLYNMAVLHFFNAQLGATCSSYELDVFDIAEITKISNTMEVLKDFQRH